MGASGVQVMLRGKTERIQRMCCIRLALFAGPTFIYASSLSGRAPGRVHVALEHGFG